MPWGLILGFLKEYAVQIAIGVAFAAWTALVYYQGGRAPRAELAALVAQVAGATAEVKREEAEDKVDSTELKVQLEKEHAKKVDDIERNWKSWADERVRNASGRSSETTEPVRITTNICNDTASDNRLSNALQRFVEGAREAHAQFSGGVERLLEQCERQTDSLVKAQAWALEESRINSE